MRLWWPAVCLLAGFVYLYLLDGFYVPRIGDEAPYIQITRLTAESGRWLPLRAGAGLENTKPPLLFWMGILSTDWADHWTLLRLRLPIVVCTFLTAALVFLLTFRIAGSRESGYLAALSFLGFASTFQYGRPFLTNMPETLFVFLPFFLLLRFRERLESWGVGFWILLGATLGVACLFKSFVLVAPAGIAIGWLRLGERGGDIREFLRKEAPRISVALLVALLSFALWPALDPDPASVLRDFVLEENLGKLGGQGYLRGLLLGPYPIWRIWLAPLANAGLFALPLLAVMAGSLGRPRAVGFEERALWMLVLSFLVVYTVPAQRQENYLLPTAPALAVLLGLQWNRIDRRWFYLFQIPILLALLLACRLMLDVGEAVLGRGGYQTWQIFLPVFALVLAGSSVVWIRLARYTFHLLSLLALLCLSCFLAPFEGPAGRFPPERAAFLEGKTVFVPSDFVSKYERHRFILPGARVEGYDPASTWEVGLLLRSRQFVAIQRPLGETVGGPYRVFARRLDLKTRHTPEELWRIVVKKDLDLLVHQEFIVRRLAVRRERPDVPAF